MDIQIFSVFYVNMYSALLLLVLLVILYIKRDIYDFSSRILKFMVIINIVLLVFEAITYLINGIDNQLMFVIHYGLNFIVFLLTPLVGFFWAVYLDNKIYHGKNRVKNYVLYLVPFAIGVILLIINIFTPVLFSIDSLNVYSRESLIMVNVSTLFILFIYITTIVLINRKNVSKSVINGALLFLVFPMIGGIIQMSFYGVATLFSTFALGIFTSYIVLETVASSRDFLTGLFIRVKAIEYINELKYKRCNFGVIMIDLDDFKKLNDNYGHSVGDKLLKCFGETLVRVFEKNAVVTRFGGDEFLIVKKDLKENEMKSYSEKIYKDFIKNVNSDILSQYLKFSMGSCICSKESLMSADEIIIEADNNMFLNKAVNKNLKRRKSDD